MSLKDFLNEEMYEKLSQPNVYLIEGNDNELTLFNLENYLIYEKSTGIRYGYSHYDHFLEILEKPRCKHIKKFYNNHKELFEFIKFGDRYIMFAKLPIETIVMYTLSKE